MAISLLKTVKRVKCAFFKQCDYFLNCMINIIKEENSFTLYFVKMFCCIKTTVTFLTHMIV